MKQSKFFSVAVGSAALLAALGMQTVHAQAAATAPLTNTRMCFVDTDRLFSETKASQAAQNKLKAEFASREKSLTALADRLKSAIEAFERDSAKMSDAKRVQEQERLMELDAEFRQKRREFQDDLNSRKNEELQSLMDRANAMVIQAAKAEDCHIILQEAVYVDPRLDITSKVLTLLDAAK